MTAWAEMRIGRESKGLIDARRISNTHTNLLDPDVISTYEVSLNQRPIGTVEHRYGDGAWRLLALAADLAAAHDMAAIR